MSLDVQGSPKMQYGKLADDRPLRVWPVTLVAYVLEHLASRFGNPVTLDGMCVLASFHLWKFVTLRQRPASIESYSAWPVSRPEVEHPGFGLSPSPDPGTPGSLAAPGAVGLQATGGLA